MSCAKLPHFNDVESIFVVFHFLFTIVIQSVSKTFPKSSLQMHWISVRFYEMGDSFTEKYHQYNNKVLINVIHKYELECFNIMPIKNCFKCLILFCNQ